MLSVGAQNSSDSNCWDGLTPAGTLAAYPVRPMLGSSDEGAVTAEQRRGRTRRLSDEHAALLLESLREYGLFALDVDGTIESWSRGTERLLGWTAADVLGASGTRIFPRDYQPDDLLGRQVARAAAGESAEWVGWLARKDGSPFWGSCAIQCGARWRPPRLCRDCSGSQ